MAFGEILRNAREQRGLTHSAVAQATNLKVQIVEDLEREDFRRIAAPIYGRGFIRLYAGFLQLDHEPLVRDFMELYSGDRPPAVRTSVLKSTGGASTDKPPKVAPMPKVKEAAVASEVREFDKVAVKAVEATEVASAEVVATEEVAAAPAGVPEVQKPAVQVLEPERVVPEEVAAKEEEVVLGEVMVETAGKLHKAPAVSVLTPSRSEPLVEAPKGKGRQVPIFQINGGSDLVKSSGGSRFKMVLGDAGFWLRERWEDLCDLVMRVWDALPLPRMESWGSRLLGVGLVLMVALMLVGITKLFKMTSQNATVVQVATPGVLESVGPPQDMFVD